MRTFLQLMAGNLALVLGMIWFSLLAAILWGVILVCQFSKRCYLRLRAALFHPDTA